MTKHKVVLNKIGVWSLAKFQAIVMAIFGLIAGIIYAMAGALLGALMGSLGLAAGLGFMRIILFPIMYGVLGLAAGAIGALIFNLVASWVGGIELELQE